MLNKKNCFLLIENAFNYQIYIIYINIKLTNKK